MINFGFPLISSCSPPIVISCCSYTAHESWHKVIEMIRWHMETITTEASKVKAVMNMKVVSAASSATPIDGTEANINRKHKLRVSHQTEAPNSQVA